MRTEAWRESARCKTADGSHDPDFFPEVGRKNEMRARAKRKCFACPVVQECLEWALQLEGGSDGNHRYGILGGMEPVERAMEHRSRRERQ